MDLSCYLFSPFKQHQHPVNTGVKFVPLASFTNDFKNPLILMLRVHIFQPAATHSGCGVVKWSVVYLMGCVKIPDGKRYSIFRTETANWCFWNYLWHFLCVQLHAAL